MIWIGVALLGGIGAILRFRLDALVQLGAVREFPFGTLAVNVLGAFALGILHGADVGGDALLLAGTALIGSFTTFSTWMLETQRLTEEGDGPLALANVGVSVALGLAAIAAGWALGAVL